MKKAWAHRLALGTVQFGLDYGISNRTGRVPPHGVAKILDEASAAGVETLDTAVAYGESEAILGAVLESEGMSFEIVSKFPRDVDPRQLKDTLQGTLRRLRMPRIKAYLAHDSACLRNTTIQEQLACAKDQGLISQFGVSVYSPDELHQLMDRGPAFDMVQLPLNVFDQRFRTMLPELKRRGVEVHVRSVFLQGLFFLEPERLSPHFDRVRSKLTGLRRLAEEHRIPLSALLLGYAMAQPDVDRIVIGVTSIDELRENLAAGAHAARCRELLSQLDALAVSDEDILVASNWR